MASELIRLGRITRAHGLRGEVEVKLDWSDGRSLQRAPRVVLEAAGGERQVLAVEGVRQTPKGTLLQLAGVADRDAAEARCGATLHVARADLPALAPGEYYLCDLVGLVVSSPEGEVGRVLEIQMYPSIDAIVIAGIAGERWELPLLDEWIERVDVGAGTLRLVSRAGLIDVSPGPSEPRRSPSRRKPRPSRQE